MRVILWKASHFKHSYNIQVAARAVICILSIGISFNKHLQVSTSRLCIFFAQRSILFFKKKVSICQRNFSDLSFLDSQRPHSKTFWWIQIKNTVGTWKWNLSNPDYKKPQQSIVNNQLRLDLKKCLLAINWLSHILQMPTRNNPIGLKCKICILEYKKLFLKERCISKLMVQFASTGATFKPNLFYKNETIL